MTRTHSLPRERWGENRPPKGKGGQDSEVWIKAGAIMSGDSMTANHVEHEIATFPGSPGRGGRRCGARPRRTGAKEKDLDNEGG
jgi:hypothetical protein